MKNWQVVYTVSGQNRVKEFATYNECIGWLSIAGRWVKNVATRVKVMELYDGGWKCRHIWSKALDD